MAQKVRIREFKESDIKDLIYHMSVQSLLDLKALYGRITEEDVAEMGSLATEAFSVLVDWHVACCVFFIPSADGKKKNMYLLASTEGFSKIKLIKEALFSVINSLQNDQICSIVYKGNGKFRSILKSSGFKFVRNVIFGKELRNFLMFER